VVEVRYVRRSPPTRGRSLRRSRSKSDVRDKVLQQGANYEMYWAQKRSYNKKKGVSTKIWHACTCIGGPHWHGIWIFSPVPVSHFHGVNAIEMAAIIIPIKRFEVQDVRPVKGQYHVNATSIWEFIPGELNENVLKFLSSKELVGFKRVCKNAKSTAESEKGLLFDAIKEQLDIIIEKCGFESVPIKFKVKNCGRLGGFPSAVGYVVNSTKRCVQIIHDGDVFKARANVKFVRNMGSVHVCPYTGEVTGELRGNWVDERQVAAGIQILMNL
jgi:hypothetical protein